MSITITINDPEKLKLLEELRVLKNELSDFTIQFSLEECAYIAFCYGLDRRLDELRYQKTKGEISFYEHR